MPSFPCLKPPVTLSAFSAFALVAPLQKGSLGFLQHCCALFTDTSLIKMQLLLKKSDFSVLKQSVKCFEIKRIRQVENITMSASSLVEQPPGHPIWGPVFAFLFVPVCVDRRCVWVQQCYTCNCSACC